VLALATLTRLSARSQHPHHGSAGSAWGTAMTHPLLSQLDFFATPSALSLFFSRLTALSAASPRARFDLYTAMPEDIRSIRRLRSSKAVCLPCDTPLHVVCGSKDVIHSWAIPGLGIKIDSIPGFSSHRRLLLRWRGVFWGQCMEVCGRYHHWMPILVHVTHKDLFISWCLVFLKTLEGRSLAPLQPDVLPAQLCAWLAAAEAAVITP
jgi:heme/copper-type cytochrome/quinol oxidase subunit 2